MGASFQLSPGVLAREWDVSEIVAMVASSAAAHVGDYQWGPCDVVTTITSEQELVQTFWKPTATNNVSASWFCAKNFLDYSRNLKTVRVVTAAAKNAVNAGTPPQIKNLDAYNDATVTTHGFIAKYPGALGNTLLVSAADHSAFTSIQSITLLTAGTLYDDTDDGTAVTISAPDEDLVADGGIGIQATATYASTDALGITGFTVTDPGAGYNELPTITVALADDGGGVAATAVAGFWTYRSQFINEPITSEYASQNGCTKDEMHMVVVDEDGVITGTAGTVLERFPYVSKASDAMNDDGTSAYFKNVLRDQSAWAFSGDLVTGLGADAHKTCATVAGAFTAQTTVFSASLAGGVVSGAITNSELMTTGWPLFENPDTEDIGLIISGPADNTLQAYLIQNIAEIRKDCVVFISPETASDVNTGTQSEIIGKVKVSRSPLVASSYGFMDSGWKYQYDAYNDVFAWVPLNGDIAGLAARTDADRDPWWSPAGYNRGHIKNVVKLGWNPNKTARDEIYPKGINPVITEAGEGTLLLGDRMLQLKPSAFDRINVRRLFIVLEKSIAKAAKYQLFEFNDEFTRMRFTQMVEPFLRDIQGRRGIYDFRVVCDTTNNTGQVIDNNQFVGDIYIKPAKSINFITLNFIATATGVDFEEIIGSFG
jgi:hypothetical protein